MNAFDKFSCVSGLKPNKVKCKIASISVLKGVSLTLCIMDCIHITKNSVKVLGIHFLCNKKILNWRELYQACSENRKSTEDMENAIFDYRKKNKIFKTLAISKIIHFSLITNVPTEIINELNKTHTQNNY